MQGKRIFCLCMYLFFLLQVIFSTSLSDSNLEKDIANFFKFHHRQTTIYQTFLLQISPNFTSSSMLWPTSITLNPDKSNSKKTKIDLSKTKIVSSYPKKKKRLNFSNYLAKISLSYFTLNALYHGNRWLSIKTLFDRHMKTVHVNWKSAKKVQYWRIRKWVDCMLHFVVKRLPFNYFCKTRYLNVTQVINTASFSSIKPIIVCTSNDLVFSLQPNKEYVFGDPMFSCNVIKNSQGWSFQ